METLLTFFSCAKASRVVAGESGGFAGTLARLHALYCSHCRRYARQLRLLAAAARARSATLTNAASVARLEKRLIERFTPLP